MIIYDTLSKTKKPFVPCKLGKVQMFVCGPTVYDDPHIGHGRSYVAFDVVAKYLKYLGYEVDFCINITDIDDKIIKKAQKEEIKGSAACQNISDKYTNIFETALCTLGVDSIGYYDGSENDGMHNATDYIDEIMYQIEELERKGFTYMLNDGLYFDLAKFPEHGKLSGRLGAGLEKSEVSRIGERTDKRNPGDFVLWKLEKPGEAEVGATWKSPWGPGRPGWHIEDTAITNAIFGPQYDIHGGGIDLIFPHHEAEICQMEAASGEAPMVNYWMHNGHLMIDANKMSKSAQNFMTIDEASDKWGPFALRYFFLSAHYRSPLNFTDEALDAAVNAVERINNFILTMKQIKEKGPEPTYRSQETREISAIGDEKFPKGKSFYHIDYLCSSMRRTFERCMNNDFNVSAALSTVFMFISSCYESLENGGCNEECFSKIDAAMALELMHLWNRILGVMNFELEIDDEIVGMVNRREAFRANKEWDKADASRLELNALGYTLDDTPNGTIIRKTGGKNGS